MRVYSKVTGRDYMGEDAVYIYNPLQFVKYIKNNATLYDVIVDKDRTGKDCAVFVFSKTETKHLFDMWCKHEL